MHKSVGTISGVTYNGVAMTTVVGNLNDSGDFGMNMWYLINPSTGANNIILTATASDGLAACATSFTGAKQSGQPDATGSAGPTTTDNFSQSVTTVADNCWIVWGFYEGSGAATTGANTTVRQQELVAYGVGIADTNSAQTPAGSKTLNLTKAGARWLGIMASFSPSLPATGNFLSLF